MSVYKRGKTYWYRFMWDGVEIRKSTFQGNAVTARQMEAAHRTNLAKGEVGIVAKAPAPTLREFASRFVEAIRTLCADKPRTVSFYEAKLKYVLENEALAKARLDAIDEEAVEMYKQTRTKVTSRRKKLISPASVNRELATLRRLLRLAQEWKILARVPRIRLLGGESPREFTLTHEQENLYLDTLPEPLKDVATVLLDTGLRIGEALSMEWKNVRLDPASGARFGFLTVLAMKAKSKKSRNVPLPPRSIEVLKKWGPRPDGLVFHKGDGAPLRATLLDQQHARVRDLLKLPAAFVLHSLRHTYGTRLGEAGADAFTIMKLMGHSNVVVSQRYVHPSPEAVENAVARLDLLNSAGRARVGTKSGTVQLDSGAETAQIQ